MTLYETTINGHRVADTNKRGVDNTIEKGWAFFAETKDYRCVYCGLKPANTYRPCPCRNVAG